MGVQHFRMVSPIYKQNIYVGAFENLAPHEVPIDFFDPNIHAMFPFVVDVDFVDAVLGPGDCMYVPAYYYIQSQSRMHDDGTTNALIYTQQYQSHSRIVDMIFEGVNNDSLIDD